MKRQACIITYDEKPVLDNSSDMNRSVDEAGVLLIVMFAKLFVRY